MPNIAILSKQKVVDQPSPSVHNNDYGIENHQYCRVDFPTIIISAFVVIITFTWLDTIRIIFRYFWIHDNLATGSEVVASLMQSLFITFISVIVIYMIHEWSHYSFE